MTDWAEKARNAAEALEEIAGLAPLPIERRWIAGLSAFDCILSVAQRLRNWADEWEAKHPLIDCEPCDGDGEVERSSFEDSSRWWKKCEPCDGTGKVRKA